MKFLILIALGGFVTVVSGAGCKTDDDCMGPVLPAQLAICMEEVCVVVMSMGKVNDTSKCKDICGPWVCCISESGAILPHSTRKIQKLSAATDKTDKPTGSILNRTHIENNGINITANGISLGASIVETFFNFPN